MKGLKSNARASPVLRALWVAGALAGMLAIAIISGLQGLSPPSTAHAAETQGLLSIQLPDGPGLGEWSLDVTFDDSRVSVSVDSAILNQDDGITAGVTDAFVVVNETTGAGVIIDEATVPNNTSGIGWLLYLVTSIGAILVATAGLIGFTRLTRRREITGSTTRRPRNG